MTGIESLAAFYRALALIKAENYDEARKVPLLPSDREIIERRIAAVCANGSNKT